MRRRVFLGGVLGAAAAVASGCSSSGPDEQAAAVGPLRLLFVGDSITNGSAAATFSASYAPLTLGMVGEVAARPDSLVGGFPGATSSVVLDRLREFRSQRPDLVVVLAGVNDAPQGVPLSTTKANLLQAVEEVGAGRCVVGVPHVPRASTPAEVQSLVDLRTVTGIRFAPGSPEFLGGGRWLELDGATGAEAGTVRLTSLPCDVSDARGRRVVLCGQCEVEVISGNWLEDVSADESGVSLGLVDGSGEFVLQSVPFSRNAGALSRTDPRVARWGPMAHPVTPAPSADVVSIAVVGKLAPGSRVRIRVGCLGLFFEDLVPGAFRAAPETSVQQLS